jgi:uncharacterized membrane protein
MVVLAGLQFLPPIASAIFGGTMILFHNLLDPVHFSTPLWHVVHERGPLFHNDWSTVVVAYPLVPWVGVMAAGYALGCWLPSEAPARKRLLVRLGAVLTLAFVIVRAIDRYGDPHPWLSQPRGAVYTVLSFLNCEKYPPSLDYLLMTLGPSLLAIGLLEGRTPGWLGSKLLVFGRVPLFYYLVHLFVLHAVSIALYVPFFVRDPEFRARILEHGTPGWGLGPTYIVWLVSLVALYPMCRWYSRLKARSSNPLLSYL